MFKKQTIGSVTKEIMFFRQLLNWTFEINLDTLCPLQISKKRAAEKMLDQLKMLPPTTTVTAANCPCSIRMKRKPNSTKKKSRNLIKVTNSSSNKVT